MANQNVIITVQGPRTGTRGLRAVAVDTNGAAWTFTDFGAAAFLNADDDLTIVGIEGQGTTAPVVTVGQFRVGGNDRQKFVNLAATFNAQATMQARLGAALGARVPQGTQWAIVSRT